MWLRGSAALRSEAMSDIAIAKTVALAHPLRRSLARMVDTIDRMYHDRAPYGQYLSSIIKSMSLSLSLSRL